MILLFPDELIPEGASPFDRMSSHSRSFLALQINKEK